MDYNKLTKKELIELLLEQEQVSGSYGLIWERQKKPEKLVYECDKNIPILSLNKDKCIEGNSRKHILIEGDNFNALSVLNYTNEGNIDIIYIDPPYNTGNRDFMYNDKFVDIEDGYRHSKWLNFMEKRLNLARSLLKDDGVIFISIDDNEYAQLKLLCDKIFGERNFIANIVLEISKTQGMKVRAAQMGQIVKNHEYVLVYTKNISFNSNRGVLYDVSEPYDEHFSKVILKENNKLNIYDLSSYIKDRDNDIYKLFEKYDLTSNGKIPIKNIAKGIIINKKIKDYFYIEMADNIYQNMDCRITLPKDIIERLDKEEVVFYDGYYLSNSTNGKIRQYRNLKETLKDNDEYASYYSRVTIRGDLWKGFYSDMMNIAKEGGVEFKNGKKPIRLMKQLIKWANRKDAVVLDFFAGSGSTAEAVLELNKEDGGNRRFILCTNNENNICTEVTLKRLNNIFKNSDDSLMYFNTEFIDNSNNRDQLYFDLTEKCIPMLCIKDENYEEYKVSDEYRIYTNKDKSKYTCIYYSLFGEQEDEFIDVLKSIKEYKTIYKFSLSNDTDTFLYDEVDNYDIEAIPYKVIELYKKIVKMSKEV